MQRTRIPRHAVTLFEVLIVISIMSISLFLALPAVDRWKQWSAQIRFETILSDSIQQARLSAVVSGTVCRIRPDRVNSCLNIEQLHSFEAHPLTSVRIPQDSVIQLTKLIPLQSVATIEIDPHGLFLHDVRIEVISGGQLYSWMTDRQTGSIVSCSK